MRSDPIKVANWIWHKLDLPRDWSVPGWYCNLYGTSPWYIRTRFEPRYKRGSKARALAFIIRMNYLMDTDLLRDRSVFPVALERRLRSLNLPFGDIASSSNFTWAHSCLYNWNRVLSCTLRVFVPLTFPLLGARFRGVPTIG